VEKTVSDGFMELHFDLNNGNVDVELQANQFQFGKHKQYSLFLEGDSYYFKGSIKYSDEEKVVISYDVPETAVTLADYLKKRDNLQKLCLVQKTFWIFQKERGIVNPFVNPENIYVVGSKTMVMHRGFQNEIMPYDSDDETFFKQYKALVTYILDPKVDYEFLVCGGGAIRSKFLNDIQSAKSFVELEQLILEQISIQEEFERKTLVKVNKKRFSIVKKALIATTILTIVSLISDCFFGLDYIPKKNNTIKAQSEFISKDYSAAVDTLEKYDPDSLSKDAKYVLAVSYINLDSLSVRQKKAVLNNVSQKSNDNILKYWIYLGRGNFSKSLNIAKNVGDSQYILYSYTKLYSATKANAQMNGVKKQRLLKEYRGQINKYLKMLGGDSNEFKAD